MEQRPLGNSGLMVSPIGLGTWAMGGTVETWGVVDDRESIAAIHQALDGGVNLIDTAAVYGLGHSEQIVGKAIQGRRDAVVLATKCGLLFPVSEDELPPRCLKKESIIRECEASLRRLRTDVIDLYQCHWPDPDTPIRETMEAMGTLLKQGKIRAVGLSNYSCEEIAAAREFAPIHCLQPPFSMIHRRASEDLLPFCLEHEIGVISYSPLAKGLLTGKFDESSKLEGIRATDPDYLGSRFRSHLAIIAKLRPIAEASGMTLAQLAINWTVRQPGISAALVGAKRPSQVAENIAALDRSPSPDQQAQIDAILRES